MIRLDPIVTFFLLPFLLLLVVSYPRQTLGLVLLGAGFLAGVLYCEAEGQRRGFAAAAARSLDGADADAAQPQPQPPARSIFELIAGLADARGGLNLPVSSDLDTLPAGGDAADGHAHYEGVSPAMRNALRTFLDYFVRDFIDWWYLPLNATRNRAFQLSVRASLEAALLNVRGCLQNWKSEVPILLSYGLSHALSQHVKEYKKFEHSGLSAAEYCAQRPNAALLNEANMMLQLQTISQTILNRTLPKRENTSPSLRVLLRELVATSVLLPIIDVVCDPDWINQNITWLLQEQFAAPPKSPVERDIDDASAGNGDAGTVAAFDPAIATLPKVLQISQGFIEFMGFLESKQKDQMLRFWMNADSFRQFSKVISPEYILQDARQIYDLHFGPHAAEPIGKVDPALLRQCQAAMLTPRAAHCFDAVQADVLRIMEADWWEPFIGSGHYQKFLRQQNLASEVVRRASESALHLHEPGSPGAKSETHQVEIREDHFGLGEPLPPLPESKMGSEEGVNRAGANAPELNPSELSDEGETVFTDTSASMDMSAATKSDLMGLTSTLSTIREQIFLLNEALSGSSTMEVLKKRSLQHKKRKLQSQAERLVRMILSHEENSGKELGEIRVSIYPAQHHHHGGGGGGRDGRDGRDGAGEPSSNILKSIGNSLKGDSAIEFIVEAHQGDEAGWVVSRNLEEFASLHADLKSLFPKAAKIQFPNLKSALSHKSHNYVDSLAGSLQTYLEVVLTDQALRQSDYVQDFLRISNVAHLKAKPKPPPAAAPQPPAALEKHKSEIEIAREKVRGDIQHAGPPPHKHRIGGLAGDLMRRASLMGEHAIGEFITGSSSGGGNDHSLAAAASTTAKASSLDSLASPGAGPSARAAGGIASDPFNPEDVEILLESTFALLEEVFDLRQQFFRRQALSMAKRYIRQNYGTTLLALLRDVLGKYAGDAELRKGVESVNGILWPRGVWGDPAPPRSEAQREATFIEAKSLLLQQLPVGSHLRSMLGKYNTMVGCQRTFDMAQQRQWNRSLAVNVLSVLVKTLFTHS